MSYSRWGESCWYCFVSNRGELEIWRTIDEEGQLCFSLGYCREFLTQDAPRQQMEICEATGCGAADAQEAIGYIKRFVKEQGYEV